MEPNRKKPDKTSSEEEESNQSFDFPISESKSKEPRISPFESNQEDNRNHTQVYGTANTYPARRIRAQNHPGVLREETKISVADEEDDLDRCSFEGAWYPARGVSGYPAEVLRGRKETISDHQRRPAVISDDKKNTEDDDLNRRVELERKHTPVCRPELPETVITGRHLGLKLTLTQSFLDSCQKILDEAAVTSSTKLSNSLWKQNGDEGCSSISYDHGCLNMDTDEKEKLKALNFPAKKEKLKAFNFPANLLRIGPDWQVCANNEGELMAKVYYAKKKIVWEILSGSLKLKMEMKWSDINSIRLNLGNQPVGSLEIELKKPPSFHHEIDHRPRKHTIWKDYIDFTDGSASNYRKHYLEFSRGVLNRHYENLFGTNGQLVNLLIDDFPSHASLYFQDPLPGNLHQVVLNDKNALPIFTLPAQHLNNTNFHPELDNMDRCEPTTPISGVHESTGLSPYPPPLPGPELFKNIVEAHLPAGNTYQDVLNDEIALLLPQSGQYLNNINHHELDINGAAPYFNGHGSAELSPYLSPLPAPNLPWIRLEDNFYLPHPHEKIENIIEAHLRAGNPHQVELSEENALTQYTLPAQPVQYMNNTYYHPEHVTPVNLIIPQDQRDNSSSSIELVDVDETNGY